MDFHSVPERQSNPPTIRLAVIGADRRGKISLLAHRPEEGVELTAACGLNVERLVPYRETCPGIHLTTDANEVFSDPSIDAVFICTPDYLHEEHAVAALKAGKDVFLEKPMAITIEGCDRIMQVARDSGKILYVGHNMRFFAVMQKMKDLVADGAVGEVKAIWCRHFVSYGGDAYFRDWHAERRFSNGLLLQKGAHDIDIIHWLAGAHTKRVVGMGMLSVYDKLPRRDPSEPAEQVRFHLENWPPTDLSGFNPVIDVEDHSMILMQLENGVQASYMQCHYTPDDQRNYTVIGTKGRLENFGDSSSVHQWSTVHLWNRRTGYSPMGHEVFRVPHSEGTHGGADPLVIDDFVGTLRGKKTKGAQPLDARMAVAVAVRGTESLRSENEPLFIPDCT